jgi:hypothetical protein
MNPDTAIGQHASPLNELVRRIRSRPDFITFLHAFLSEFRQNPEQWENRDLSSFLNAMSAWVVDMDGYYQNQGECVPDQPSWKTVGEMLLAAAVYE